MFHQPCNTEGTVMEPVDDISAFAVSAAADLLGDVSRKNAMCLIRGSFHQGDERFGSNRYKQCTTNSVTAIMTHVSKSILTWTTEDIDYILVCGDRLYTFMKQQDMISDANGSGYIFVHELPREVVFRNKKCSLEYFNTYTGDIDLEVYDAAVQDVAMPLEVALQRAMLQADACLVTIKSNTFAIIKQGSRFAVFDPHARGDDGGLDPKCSSIVACYDSFIMLYEHISNLAESLYGDDAQRGNRYFEVTGVKAVVTNGICYPAEDVDQVHCDIESVVDIDKVSAEESLIDVESETKAGTESDNESTVYLVSETDAINVTFRPLTLVDKKRICTKLRIVPSLHYEDVLIDSKEVDQPVPCTTTYIHSDGNCFFGALSHVFSGSETYHRAVRLAVVKHVEQSPDVYRNLLRQEFTSVQQYVRDSQMKYVGTWATEVEIQAAADLFNVDIYTYSRQKWLKYSSSGGTTGNKGIYLKHCNECHYEPIACVKDNISSKCFSLSTLREINHGKSSSDVISPRKACNDRLKRKKREKYADDSEFRKCKIMKVQHRYSTDSKYRQTQQQASVRKYATNEEHKAKVIQAGKDKYSTNQQYRAKIRQSSVQKYASDDQFSAKVKHSSFKKYANSPDHRARVIHYTVQKYKSNPVYAESIKKRNQEKKRNQTLKKHNIDVVIQQFREKVKQGPEYVCCVCHRLLFQHQVVECKKEQYGKKGSGVASLADKCITSTYLHDCNDRCTADCILKLTHVGKLWICYTCHRKIIAGKVPEESAINNLQLDPIPQELNTLNSLEQHLIAQNIPFMKVLALPKGGQNGVHGPVTCVPSNSNAVNNVLPRLENQDLMIRVKLKRKITYKGHYQYQYVHTNKVHSALEHLKYHNKWYKDVQINKDWTNPLEKDKNDDGDKSDEGEDLDIQDEHINDQQQHGMYLDTCMQPVDVAQEVLDQHFDSVLSVAPAEGNSPVRLLTDVSNEAKCFPVLFPKETGTFHDTRQHKLTLSWYLNARILNADGRFGSNLDYIFYAQYLSEINQVVSNVSIALRKGYHGGENTQITSSMLSSTDFVKNVLSCDMGYKFLKPIRGTPVFWQGVQKDLFAMVRQLGIPTWFCPFSSADLRWTELMETFMKVHNLKGNVNEMDWSQKCNLLKNNPVTAARMFDHRFRCFLRDVIMSPAQPIGKIIDYFYRVEFQQRGSPHTHCLFWVENAPKIGTNTDQEVIDLIDKYVTCDLHLKLMICMRSFPVFKCTVRNTPRVVKRRALHAGLISHDLQVTKHFCVNQKQRSSSSNKINLTRDSSKVMSTRDAAAKAQEIMRKVKLALSNEEATFDSIDAMFSSIGINQSIFEKAYQLTSKKTSVVLKRNINDVWVNQYNKDLLRCWNANLDIQFVCDAYACVVYIISYLKSRKGNGFAT